jgi:Tfp pilus assembly protein PilV
MIIFLLTVSLCLLLLVVGLLVYLLYAVRSLMDTQDVIFDAAVNAEEMYNEIQMNQESILTPIFGRIEFKRKIFSLFLV